MKSSHKNAFTAHCLVSYAVVLLFTKDATGIYNFFLLPFKTNAFEGLRQCRERGYDGLAALSTPEAYLQALEMTVDWRAKGNGVDVGLYYFHNESLLLWSDGNQASPDLPWSTGYPTWEADRVVGRIYHKGTMMIFDGKIKKKSLCGDYGTSEARFSIAQASEPEAFENWTIAESFEPSYISCSVRCGLQNLCRGAVFKMGVKTCKLFNTNLPLNITFKHNPQAMTFVRTRYAPH